MKGCWNFLSADHKESICLTPDTLHSSSCPTRAADAIKLFTEASGPKHVEGHKQECLQGQSSYSRWLWTVKPYERVFAAWETDKDG